MPYSAVIVFYFLAARITAHTKRRRVLPCAPAVGNASSENALLSAGNSLFFGRRLRVAPIITNIAPVISAQDLAFLKAFITICTNKGSAKK